MKILLYHDGKRRVNTAWLQILVFIICGWLTAGLGIVQAGSKEEDFVVLCARGTVEEVRQALANGADANAMGDSMTPLITAILDKSHVNAMEKVKILLAAKADPNARNLDGLTALHYAVNQGNIEVVELLLSVGAEANTSAYYYPRTPLSEASFEKNWPPGMQMRLLTLLLKAGADVSGTHTPLVLAAAKSEPAVIKLLLDAGCEVNLANDVGNTPLIVAAGFNPDPETVRVLLEAGADPTLRNQKGENALDRAEYNTTPAAARIKELIANSPLLK